MGHHSGASTWLRRAVAKQLEGSVTSGLSLTRIVMVCVPTALVIRGALFVAPERYNQIASFEAPFIFGAAVLIIGAIVGLPEFNRLFNVIRRRKS